MVSLGKGGSELDLQIAARVVNLDASRVRWFIEKDCLPGTGIGSLAASKRLPVRQARRFFEEAKDDSQ